MSTMDRPVIEELAATVHRHELFTHAGTTAQARHPQSHHLAYLLLLAIPLGHELDRRIAAFRRSGVLSRLVEFRNDRLLLA